MNTSKIIILLVVISILLNACQDDEKPTIDIEKPLIDLTILDAFPTSLHQKVEQVLLYAFQELNHCHILI